MNKRLLLVFARTPNLGLVKTRLAQSIGDQKALQVYTQLLQITQSAAAPVKATKWICYADGLPEGDDLWSAGGFVRKEQPQHQDLGERMHHMFAQGLVEGYLPVVIIGSDCPGIRTALIENAFKKLTTHDVVLGPAEDGGYYLLGLNFLVPELFTAIPWSTSEVLQATLTAAQTLDLNVAQLPVLSDLDTAEDLKKWPHLFSDQA